MNPNIAPSAAVAASPAERRRPPWLLRAERLRDRIFPGTRAMGWAPVLGLGYLAFLWVPAVMAWLDAFQMWLTLASVFVFLPLYVASHRAATGSARLFACVLALAALAYALTPFNPFANTYMVYAAATAAFVGPLRRGLGLFALLMVVYCLQLWWLEGQMFAALIAGLVGIPVCIGNHHWLLKQNKDAALRLSNQEVRRLAQVAERERISRDLHDLLGHTLSLIALKAELARRLVDRDPQAAGEHIAEVERVARSALSQVRRAVTGIRAATLPPELAAARLLLEAGGTAFDYSLADIELSPVQETCLALVLRETVTNIHRHARARQVEAGLRREGDDVLLSVSDDGIGGVLEQGNGLRGMAERLAALSGSLRVDSPPGRGTRLVARLPLAMAGGGTGKHGPEVDSGLVEVSSNVAGGGRP